jgi:hypothetical protein
MGRIVSAVWSVVNVTVPFVLTRLSTNADHEMRPPSFQCLIDCLVKISDCPSAIVAIHVQPSSNYWFASLRQNIRHETQEYRPIISFAVGRFLDWLKSTSRSCLIRFSSLYTGEKREKRLICYGIINPILPVLFKRIHRVLWNGKKTATASSRARLDKFMLGRLENGSFDVKHLRVSVQQLREFRVISPMTSNNWKKVDFRLMSRNKRNFL